MARPPEENLIYARELGITKKRLIAFGGATRLKSMTEESRAVMLGHPILPPSRELRRGGIAKVGMGQGAVMSN